MKDKFSVGIITKLAMLIAISVVAAYIPLPSPIGTVALDSAPGFFAVLAYGWAGTVVLGIGHIFSALKMGFPLGGIHLLIAFFMGLCGLIYFKLYRNNNLIIASLVGILFNGIIIPLTLIPFFGKGFFISMLGPLLLGAAVNIVVSGILYRILNERIEL